VKYAEAGHLTADNGDRVFYEVAGSGPTVVLTHDALLHREAWDAQFVALAEAYRVARWDRRGYGLSDQPRDEYSSMDDLVAILRLVSDAPATLVGCSYGGLVSLQCALDYPELVGALVLVGPIVSGLGFSEHFMTRGGRRLPSGVVKPVDAEIDYWSRTDPWFVAAENSAARERLRELLSAHPHNLLPKAALERRPERAALTRLGQISIPTLIAVGDQDIPDVHAHAGAIQAGIPRAERVVLSGSGHLPNLEVPDVFNQIVLDFLGRTDTSELP
jgi:3-oxoadipate enol-lactonase